MPFLTPKSQKQGQFFLGCLSIMAAISCSTFQKADLSCSGDCAEETVKLILVKDTADQDSAHWYVDGTVGDRPYRFILDTGAGLTKMVTDNYLLRFNTIATKDSSGVFSKTKYDLITVPKLRVGPLSKTNFTIALTAKNEPDVKPVLGMNFFKDNAFNFLFETEEVQVIDRSQIPPQLVLLDLFMGENSHPYVDLSWQGVRAQGVWDTGAGMTVFDSGFIKKYPRLFRRVGSSTGTDSTGTKSETPIYEMRGFVLGGQQFPSTRIVAADLSIPNSTIKTPMDFILGFNVLRKANWLFDFRNRKWAILKMLP